MSFLDSMNIAGSALTAERFRMDVALQNIANATVTRTAAGEPYRRKQVVFQERAVSFGGRRRPCNPGGGKPAGLYPSLRPFPPRR